jgi:hypothetical protein
MSNWCQSHPTYSAKREPNSLCGKCWSLFNLKNPERRGPEQDERKAVKGIGQVHDDRGSNRQLGASMRLFSR